MPIQLYVRKKSHNNIMLNRNQNDYVEVSIVFFFNWRYKNRKSHEKNK